MSRPEAKRILLIGAGHLGMRTLEALMRRPGLHSYVVAGRDGERTRRVANMARQYASAFGDIAIVEPATIDVSDVASTAATIDCLQPDIIFSCVTMQSWWVTGTLPAHLADPLAPSCVGPWLPMHLTLVYELMQAVRAAACSATVVNASYPDVTHPVLAAAGLAPHVGIGNIAIPLVGLRLHLADRYQVPITDVHLRAVFHHYVNYMATRTGDPRPAPMHLSGWLGDDPASASGNSVQLVLDTTTVFKPLTSTLKRLSGPDFQHVTAAAAAVVLCGLLDETDVRTHAPGPLGLPGGYPVHISGGQVHLDLPAGVDLSEAVRINTDGGRYDGIESIDGVGTVRFRADNLEPLKRLLGYECEELRLIDSRSRAEELADRFAQYGVAKLAALPKS